MMGMDIPVAAIRRQIASGIDLMIHLGRLRDKRRVLMEISEIDECRDGEIIINPLYCFQELSGGKNGEVHGTWVKKGELHHKEKLLMAGISDD